MASVQQTGSYPVTDFRMADVWLWLEDICDPEIPVLSVIDLGIVRKITLKTAAREISSTIEAREYAEESFSPSGLSAFIEITPTYTGCPAMNMLAANIRLELNAHGIEAVEVREVLSPAWTTDWIPAQAREKLREYGISPPESQARMEKLLFSDTPVTCPHCGSRHTERIAEFGSTACKSLHRCLDCREPFDYFKCH